MGPDLQQTASGDRLVSTPVSQADEVVVIPVIAEELIVLAMEQDIGGLRATKVVREHEMIVDEPLLREEITVERKAINRFIDVAAEVRQEGDTLIIPVMEEVMVAQRQLVLKEEVHIRKRQFQVHEPQRFTVRSEEVKLQHLPAEDNFPSSKQTPPVLPEEAKGASR